MDLTTLGLSIALGNLLAVVYALRILVAMDRKLTRMMERKP